MLTTLIVSMVIQSSVPAEMPELGLRDAAGKVWKKASLEKDRVYLVEFWATWCTSCRAMHPMIKEFVAGKKEEKFTYLAVSVDEDLGALRGWLKKEKPEYPVLMDPTFEAMNRWKVKEVPSFFMIKNREIKWKHTGVVSKEDLESAFQLAEDN